MKLEASDRVMLRAYYNDLFSLNTNEITYCEELIKSIINEKLLEDGTESN